MIRVLLLPLVLIGVAACAGVDVSPVLAEKVRSGCAGVVNPEIVAVITEGLQVESVTGEWPDDRLMNSCSVFVMKGGGGTRSVLEVMVSFLGSKMVENQQRLLCRERPGQQLIVGSEGACGTFRAESRDEDGSGGDFHVFGNMGEYSVTIRLVGVAAAAEENGRDAAFQILADIRSSEKFRS